MYRTDEELDCIAIEAGKTAKRAYATPHQERAPDPDRCGWRCDYTEACLFGRKKGDQAEIDFLRSSGYKQDFTRH